MASANSSAGVGSRRTGFCGDFHAPRIAAPPAVRAAAGRRTAVRRLRPMRSNHHAHRRKKKTVVASRLRVSPQGDPYRDTHGCGPGTAPAAGLITFRAGDQPAGSSPEAGPAAGRGRRFDPRSASSRDSTTCAQSGVLRIGFGQPFDNSPEGSACASRRARPRAKAGRSACRWARTRGNPPRSRA